MPNSRSEDRKEVKSSDVEAVRGLGVSAEWAPVEGGARGRAGEGSPGSPGSPGAVKVRRVMQHSRVEYIQVVTWVGSATAP